MSEIIPVSIRQPDLAVAVIVREKFGVTLECLQALYDRTGVPFRLILVVNAYPESTLDAMRRYLADKCWVSEIVLPGHHRLPNEALNAAMGVFIEEHLVVIDNDMVVETGYLEALLETAKRRGADVVQPLLLEGRGSMVHFDPPISHIQILDGRSVSMCARIEAKAAKYPGIACEPTGVERQIKHVERHFLLLSRKAVEVLFPLENFINTREWLDISFRLHEAGLEIWFTPNAVGRYVMTQVCSQDRDYFEFRWSPALGEFSNKYVRDKWKIADFVPSTEFIARMNREFDKRVPGVER